MIEQLNNGVNKQKIFTLGRFDIILKNGDIYHVSGRSNKIWRLFKFLVKSQLVCKFPR